MKKAKKSSQKLRNNYVFAFFKACLKKDLEMRKIILIFAQEKE